MIYLDHGATAPLLPAARVAMIEALDVWGNPSSVHGLGRVARDLVERARVSVAGLIGAISDEIVFTSGGTEANHTLVRGLAHAARAATGRIRVVTTHLEHPSVHGALDALATEGFEIVRLPVDSSGLLMDEQVQRAIETHAPALLTLAVANHEIGTVYPIARWATFARQAGALVHADAVAAAGRVSIDVRQLGVDGLTVSAHKIGGPKGVGAAYVRTGVLPLPWMTGGHQERERRAGTENVVGIAGFGAAAQVAVAYRADAVAALRESLQAGLQQIPGIRFHGDLFGPRTPGVLNVAFAGVPGQMVMVGLDLEGICVATGSACSSGSIAPSPVILALGQNPTAAREAVRFSLGAGNTAEEISQVVTATAHVVARIRAAS